MKKLNGPQDFKIGGIYNVVYIGSNEAYAKVNGKQTILVLETAPKLKAQELFDNSGSTSTDQLRGSVCTYGSPEIWAKEREFFEPADESEWFKKCAKVTSLKDAIEQGFLSEDQIRSERMRSRDLVPVFAGEKLLLDHVYASFCLKGIESNPYLQTVFVIWKTWEELYADFDSFGIDVRR